MPVSHVLIPFLTGLMVLCVVKRKNVLFDRDKTDEYLLLGLAVGGFFPDLDSIKYFGLEHRGIIHHWWMALIFAVLVVMLGKLLRNKNLNLTAVGFTLGYWSHLLFDFRTRQVLAPIQWLALRILNVRLQNEAEMVLDGVLILALVTLVLEHALRMRRSGG